MALTPIPTFPPIGSATFNADAYAWAVFMAGTHQTELDALVTAVDADATTATTQAGLATTNGAAQVALAAAQVALATTQAGIATTQATAAAASALVAGATLWVSGTTYAIGNARYSPANGQTYRRLTAGAGTTDPSADTTNWVIVNGITSEAILLTTNNLPTVRPTLNLDFANSKIVDPRITFTRASTATRTNEKGLLETVASGAPRIDYDPVTLACKGLLIEESRTNLLTYSEQFDNAAWTKARSSISANATTAPDGTSTADKLVEDTTASNTHFIEAVVSTTSGTTYTFSVYVKAGERTKLALNAYTNTSIATNFDLSAVTASNAYGTITTLLGGWYRCSITFTSGFTGNGFFDIYLRNASDTSTYTGDGTSGIYLFGAQLEAGAFATSYVSTTSAQVTRAADIATMTGSNFSSWYRQDEFTSVVRFIANAVGTQVYAKWNDTTANEEIKLESVSGTLTLTVTDGGVAQAAIALGSVVTGTTYTVAATWKVNDIAASINGGAVVTDTAATLPTPTQRVIGSSVTVRGYPKRLANATLVALSTP